jgi:hypothetical protein
MIGLGYRVEIRVMMLGSENHYAGSFLCQNVRMHGIFEGLGKMRSDWVRMIGCLELMRGEGKKVSMLFRQDLHPATNSESMTGAT